MNGYGLGASALTTASHVILVIVLLMVFHGAQRVIAERGSFAIVASSQFFRWSVFSVFSALIVERIYYIGARLMRPLGFDLWQSHPAPELLSAAVAASLFCLSVSGQVALSRTKLDAFKAVMSKVVMLTFTYLVIVAALH